jgi:hypothetical protein
MKKNAAFVQGSRDTHIAELITMIAFGGSQDYLFPKRRNEWNSVSTVTAGSLNGLDYSGRQKGQFCSREQDFNETAGCWKAQKNVVSSHKPYINDT